MYLLVADEDGVAGVTVWGDTVRQITGTSDCIGRAVAIPGCTLSFYNGKRSLNVPRNAIVHFTATSPAQNWWEQKLDGPVVNTQQLLQMPDHTVANVLAICGSITRQEKTQGMQVTLISGMWLMICSDTCHSRWLSENGNSVDHGGCSRRGVGEGLERQHLQ
jgi:hypothetical protein